MRDLSPDHARSQTPEMLLFVLRGSSPSVGAYFEPAPNDQTTHQEKYGRHSSCHASVSTLKMKTQANGDQFSIPMEELDSEFNW
jgi:hypothetical protein